VEKPAVSLPQAYHLDMCKENKTALNRVHTTTTVSVPLSNRFVNCKPNPNHPKRNQLMSWKCTQKF